MKGNKPNEKIPFLDKKDIKVPHEDASLLGGGDGLINHSELTPLSEKMEEARKKSKGSSRDSNY